MTQSTPDIIFGGSGNQTISVDSSLSFTWVPAPGNSYSWSSTSYDWMGNAISQQGTSPSTASGTVTFQGVSAGQTFANSAATSLQFYFSDGLSASDQNMYWDSWSWNPATGVLDPQGSGGSWDDWIGFWLNANSAYMGTAHWSGSTSDEESGSWVVSSPAHDATVFAGSGDDTIYGGVGDQQFFGGAGDDSIMMGVGDQIAVAGSGNTVVHAGLGDQIIEGGSGNNWLWAGTGSQTVVAGTGATQIHGGTGTQTLDGGSGNDTIWAGTGAQVLSGGAGNDTLYTGAGDDTLYGGTGSNLFIIGSGGGHDVITDFRAGDVVQIARGIDGLSIAAPADLASHVSQASGGAVLSFGAAASVTLLHVSAQSVEQHAAQWFRIS